MVSRKGRATAHTFRDTFAARQIEAGATLYELQHLLGHASPTMTQKYAHIYADFGIKAASRLDRLHEANGSAGAAVKYPVRVTTLSPVLLDSDTP